VVFFFLGGGEVVMQRLSTPFYMRYSPVTLAKPFISFSAKRGLDIDCGGSINLNHLHQDVYGQRSYVDFDDRLARHAYSLCCH
jgi:hypothetical protein